MKEWICAACGAAGATISALVGGFDAALITLLIFMGLDYITGIIVAAVFHKSTKTETGALESKAGWKGLCRKCMVFLLVLIGARLDLVMGTNVIRDGICFAFIANETISLIENAGLMGLPIPAALTKAVELLKTKSEKGTNEE